MAWRNDPLRRVQDPARGPGASAFLEDVLAGLAAPRKTLPGKYLWDEHGSITFDRICSSEDYYPTRRETALLRAHAAEVADLVGPGADIVEYGSGASVKVRILLDAAREPRRYVAIDISEEFIRDACARIEADYPHVEVVPVYGDYTRTIQIPGQTPGRPVLGFFPGSTIGNFDAAGVVGFLDRARRTLGPSWFLVGADPNRDPGTLQRAYADREGLMAELHGNILTRINRDLGADFDRGNFRHEARVLEGPPRVEAHLVAQEGTSYWVGGTMVRFEAGESIHTDTSFKYSPETFRDLAAQAGWEPVRCWLDPDGMMSLHLLRC